MTDDSDSNDSARNASESSHGNPPSLQQQLDEARQQVQLAQSMALRFESELQAERERIARDVGEGLADQVATLRTLAQTLEHRLGTSEPSLAQLAMMMKGNAETLLADLRHLVRRLRPETLAAGGLEVALRALIDDWRLRRPQQRFELLLDAEEGVLALSESEVEAAVYRFVEMALQDAAQIDRWRQPVTLTLVSARAADDRLTLQIVHDGLPRQSVDHMVGGPAWVDLIARLHALGATFVAAEGDDANDHAATPGGVELIVVAPWPVEL